MPKIEVSVSVDVPEGTCTLDELETLVDTAVRRGGVQLLQQAISRMEPGVLGDTRGARQRRSERYVLTRFGEVRFLRWKVMADGRYAFPLDGALGLSSHDTIAPGLFAELVFLAQAMPFRTAADAASRLLGFTLDHRRLWRATQKAGLRVRDDLERTRRELFELGVAPDPGGPHRMVVVEADGTMIRLRQVVSTRKVIVQGEVKLAIFYAGKRVTRSGTGTHARRATLLAKGAYASTQASDLFGQTAFVAAEEQVGLSRARFRLAISDGGSWLPLVFTQWLRTDAHQLDHFHGRRRCAETPGVPREVGERWWEQVVAGDLDRVVASVRAHVARGSLDPIDARNLVDYLRSNLPRLHAAAELQKKGAPAALCVRGSGSIEHNVDIIVARRMKKKGMFWSKGGADNMLALRCAALDPKRWKEAIAA